MPRLPTGGYQPEPGPAPGAPPSGGSAIRPAPAASRAIELAYGLLWTVPVDVRTRQGLAIRLARHALLEQLDRDGQARAITAARAALELGDRVFDEANCPGHVASARDPKICGRCGVHIDSLRPD